MLEGLLTTILTPILLPRFAYYCFSTVLLHRAFVPLKDGEAQSGPLPGIIWCHLCVLKPRIDAEEIWRNEADVGCGWGGNNAETSEKPWRITWEPAVHPIALTAPGINKKELTSGIKLSIHWVCMWFCLVMPWLKICTWLRPWPEKSFWAFPPQLRMWTCK